MSGNILDGKIMPTNIDLVKSGLGNNKIPIIKPNNIETYDFISLNFLL